MSTDKISGSGPTSDVLATAAALAAAKTQAALAKNTVRAPGSQAAPAPVVTDAATQTVTVSAAASEMLQAVRTAGTTEGFDQKKVDRLRKEIADGRVPLDAQKLAEKFLDLEMKLGNLGRK
jgi:negative regulator of flagellin synthesis FlgM